MLSSQIIPKRSTSLEEKVKELEQQNTTLSNMYEDILLKYTQADAECNKYKQLTVKYKNLYENLQSNFNAPDLAPDLAVDVFDKPQYQNNQQFAAFKDYSNNNDNNNNNMTDYKLRYNTLYEKYQHLESEHKCLESKICKLEHEKYEYISTISELKKDLSSAQKDILEMTNIVGVKQTLPTVQETMSQFYNIRDQSHHNTCSQLKTYIKLKFKQHKYQKYYITQCVHEFMFKTLIKCNCEVIQYRKDMFDSLSQKLNMDYTLKQIYYNHSSYNYNIYDHENYNPNINNGHDHDQQFIDSEKEKILGNRLGSYFRENYNYILKTDMLKSNVMNYMFKQCQHFIDLEKENEIMDCYSEYILQCIDICWVMSLQEPALKIIPCVWRPNGIMEYNDKYNKRVLGSDRKCNHILYYVWPNLMRNENILKNQKTEVVTKNELYTPNKLKKLKK